MKRIKFVGLDVHAETIAVCAAKYTDRRPTRMEVVATKTAGLALFLSITS